MLEETSKTQGSASKHLFISLVMFAAVETSYSQFLFFGIIYHSSMYGVLIMSFEGVNVPL